MVQVFGSPLSRGENQTEFLASARTPGYQGGDGAVALAPGHLACPLEQLHSCWPQAAPAPTPTPCQGPSSEPHPSLSHFTAIVKHNDSYPGEKLGSILYFIASKRTFFSSPQSAAGRSSTINLRKVPAEVDALASGPWCSKQAHILLCHPHYLAPALQGPGPRPPEQRWGPRGGRGAVAPGPRERPGAAMTSSAWAVCRTHASSQAL